MSKHILCAIDLTHMDNARALVTEAGRIANMEQALLSVVTVLPDYGSSFVGSFFKDGTLKGAAEAARQSLHALVDEVLPDAGTVQCIVEIGSAYEEILDAAKKCDADMIIVGAHKPDLADRIIGPNAARIVRHADVSVLVLRI
ncbi:universal stress protein [Actibacterium pelagium]|uniref:Universal stress protein n=1 Tax=Actibacterium pelagium TaxID=2029103 RepID=A0A917AGS1_9RHOB|nr:universal stress protein [Actibacterium pelagium]GGE47338.1 universal stress protein UspA [Actibacterium pelagium]